MSTLLDLKTETRALINELTVRVISDADLTRWANFGIRDFSARAKQYERIVAKAVTAYQGEYSLPTDILKLKLARFQVKYRLEVVDLSKWASITFYTASPTGIPTYASMSPHDKIIRIYPPPSVSSPTTTLNGEGGIDSSTTTIEVVSTASFPKSGYILIENEQIRYENTNSTNFLLCRRGDGDTTAAAHSGGTTVTEGRLVLTTAAMPPTLSADGDVLKFPDQWLNAICEFMAWKADVKRKNYDNAQVHFAEYVRIRDEAALENFWDSDDGSPAIKDEETDMGWGGNY